jgi:hypothetical protein
MVARPVGAKMSAMTSLPSDPRAVVEYRVPAASLRPGDLVNLSPGEDDWQQVVSVFTGPTEPTGPSNASEELRELVASLAGRYVVVEFTDLAPVDNNIHFIDGVAYAVATDDGDDEPISELISTDDGGRIYLYTKFELVAVRSAG